MLHPTPSQTLCIPPCLRKSRQIPRLLGSSEETERASVNKQKQMSRVAHARVYTQDIGENESSPTRLNAPIPNDIPPWRCSWLGPLRQCRDLTRVCSSLCETVGKRAKHEWLYNTDLLSTNNLIGVRAFLPIVSEFCAFLMFLQQKAKHLSPRKHTHPKISINYYQF